MTRRRLYLAGPDVFLPNAAEIGLKKVGLCEAHGFKAVFPLDAELRPKERASLSQAIFEANMAAITDCDAVIANLTPFRSVSADPGTVFEIAYALALGKKVFAYTAKATEFKTRLLRDIGGAGQIDAHGRLLASDGMIIEDFGLIDNLMIVEGVRAQGWGIVQPAAGVDFGLADLSVLEACLRQAKAVFDAADGLAPIRRI